MCYNIVMCGLGRVKHAWTLPKKGGYVNADSKE